MSSTPSAAGTSPTCDHGPVTETPQQPYDVILFDLDGTISDSAPGIIASLRHCFDAVGIEQPTDAEMGKYLGPPLSAALRDWHGLDESMVERGVDAYREVYHDNNEYNAQIFAGMPELLQELNDLGIPIATATSKPIESATRVLDHFDLTHHFVMIGGAQLDGTNSKKPDVINYVFDEMDIHPDSHRIIMIGDRSHDVHGAKHHGIPVIGVEWGYADPGELEAAGADYVVGSVAELRAILLGE